MWLVTTLLAASVATVMWILAPRGPRQSYRLSELGLMLWGATVMILIDHVLGYEGGEFLKITTEGMITSGALLGVVMLIPVLVAWGALVLITRARSDVRRA